MYIYTQFYVRITKTGASCGFCLGWIPGLTDSSVIHFVFLRVSLFLDVVSPHEHKILLR